MRIDHSRRQQIDPEAPSAILAKRTDIVTASGRVYKPAGRFGSGRATGGRDDREEFRARPRDEMDLNLNDEMQTMSDTAEPNIANRRAAVGARRPFYRYAGSPAPSGPRGRRRSTTRTCALVPLPERCSKIVPSRITAVSARSESNYTAIKRARFLALLPYVIND